MGGGRGHHRGMGASDRHLREDDFAADEAARRLGDDIAGVDLDFRAQLLQRHQEKVDRSRADRAAAGQRDAGFAGARQQRGDDPEACAHFRDEVIGRGRIDDLAGGQMRRLAGIDALPGPLAVQRIIDAVIAENAHERTHIGEARQVFQGERFLGQEARDHQRQRGVLGAGNPDFAVQPRPASDLNPVHDSPFAPLKFRNFARVRLSSRLGETLRRPWRIGVAGAPRCCALRRFRFSRSAAARRSRLASSRSRALVRRHRLLDAALQAAAVLIGSAYPPRQAQSLSRAFSINLRRRRAPPR